MANSRVHDSQEGIGVGTHTQAEPSWADDIEDVQCTEGDLRNESDGRGAEDEWWQDGDGNEWGATQSAVSHILQVTGAAGRPSRHQEESQQVQLARQKAQEWPLTLSRDGVFRYPGGRFPRKNTNKGAADGVFRYPGGRFPRKNTNKGAAGKWGG
ncbi:hypothetical protein NDU88_006168 [Pleurodeles waltl]|uniref:Uncharacterized protein n=1 Tax=Pleurodeles waltl TaxID=8319 RepID=A0AAV7SNS3_PLEWA|nr:hypothetical protein NDU88_006168 [Pleurodeles waltl]